MRNGYYVMYNYCVGFADIFLIVSATKRSFFGTLRITAHINYTFSIIHYQLFVCRLSAKHLCFESHISVMKRLSASESL